MRLVIIVLALLAASLAAGFVVALAVLLPDVGHLGLETLDEGPFAVLLTFGAIFVSGFALVPALLVVLVSEGLGIRSVLFYALAGALAGVAIYLSLGGVDFGALAVEGFTRREAEIMAGAGIIAGVVYWAIAGRSAGGRTTEDRRQRTDKA
jgi:hypothetical protein